MEASGSRATGVWAGGITTDYTDEDETPDPKCGIPMIRSRNQRS